MGIFEKIKNDEHISPCDVNTYEGDILEVFFAYEDRIKKLIEENRKVVAQYDKVVEQNKSLQAESMQYKISLEDERNKKIYRQAIATFGETIQLTVAIEELAELQKEITKYLRSKGDDVHIAEEMADVEIMLEQLNIIFPSKTKDIIKREKIKRLQRLM